MNWLTNYVRPKIRAVLKKRETPDNLWHKCRGCGQLVFHKEYEESLYVCPSCNHHERISSRVRFAQLFDDANYATVKLPRGSDDPLRFRDQKRYSDRLKTARSDTGFEDAMEVAHGNMGGHTVTVAVQNFAFMAGSMGVGVGDALVAAARKAVSLGSPLVVFTAAGGARMQEGILSLMQMPRSTVAVEMVRDAGLPYIAVMTDPTTGGVTASYAMLGDIQIAEPGALIAFAGPRVIENTIREKLPEGFQRAEYLYEHGMLDMVVERKNMRSQLIRVVDLLMRPSSDLPRLTAAKR
ncbi:MAG: acetyl-CoA carboxylase, carboxyltransferase subunit beta [Sphingomonadales bacterium]